MAEQKPIDVMLFGLGAIGSYYSFILSRSDNVRLTVVARSNYDTVKANGFLLRSKVHGEQTVKPHKVVKTAAEAEQTYDFVVCCHKGVDQDAVAKQIAPAVDQAKTTIVIIQNGVGNEEPFRKTFPETTILSCITWVGAIPMGPGVFGHNHVEDMEIGLFPNEKVDSHVEDQRLRAFESVLTSGKTVVQVVPNIQVQRWEKVVWNAAWSPLTALTSLGVKTWLASPDATMLTRRLMTEVIDVGRACGVPLEDKLIDELLTKVDGMGDIGSSMQTDYKNGKPMEVDIILGYPVKKGRELNMSIPTVETLYVLMNAINNRLLEQKP